MCQSGLGQKKRIGLLETHFSQCESIDKAIVQLEADLNPVLREKAEVPSGEVKELPNSSPLVRDKIQLQERLKGIETCLLDLHERIVWEI